MITRCRAQRQDTEAVDLNTQVPSCQIVSIPLISDCNLAFKAPDHAVVEAEAGMRKQCRSLLHASRESGMDGHFCQQPTGLIAYMFVASALVGSVVTDQQRQTILLSALQVVSGTAGCCSL